MANRRDRERERDRDPAVSDDQIPGPNKDFARAVRRLAGSELSLRQLELKLGVNQRTLDSMLKGGNAEIVNIIQFARSLKVNPNRLLRLAGHPETPEFDLVVWENDQHHFPFSPRPLPTDLLSRLHLDSAVLAGTGEVRATGGGGGASLVREHPHHSEIDQSARPEDRGEHEDDETYRIRLAFEVIMPDGSVRPLTAAEMTPERRKRITDLLMSGELYRGFSEMPGGEHGGE